MVPVGDPLPSGATTSPGDPRQAPRWGLPPPCHHPGDPPIGYQSLRVCLWAAGMEMGIPFGAAISLRTPPQIPKRDRLGA